MKTERYVELNSVGSIIDTKTGMVYPQNNDGTPDLYCGGYVADCDIEWLEAISDEDWEKIKKLPNLKQNGEING